MKVRDRWSRWAAIDAAALFVVFDEQDLVRRSMLAGLEADALPFKVLVDRERAAYVRWGMGRAPWHTIWLDPDLYRAYWRLLRSGERLRSGGSDTLQLGGDFVIGPDGAVVLSRPQRRDDRPAVGALLQAARTAAAG